MSRLKTHFTSFAALNLTQFFSAINDNIYKLLLVFMLINIQGAAASNTILSLAGAIFVIPFILLASVAGGVSDHFSKRGVIITTRLIELVVICLGVLAMALKSAVIGYTTLFLMATQSTLFSPSKFGIIPEIVKKEKISRCNGIMTATTYLAIILGTFLASFLAEVTNKNFVVASFACVVIAVLGAASSLGIEKTKAQAKGKKISFNLLPVIYGSLKRARSIRYLLPVILFGAYFLFMGAYTQLNIIPFAMQTLGLSEIQGGYLFLMTAIGIGIGSFTAGKLSRDEVEIGYVPLAALGIGIVLTLLYLFGADFYVASLLLIFLGIFGGFYVVPIDAFIQTVSPSEDRGQNVAAYNFMSFIGVIIASALIALFGNGLTLSAAQGFFVVGILTLLMALFLLIVMADQVLRLIVSKLGRYLWRLRVSGRKRLIVSSPVLFVGERTSWLDTIVVMATLPRLIRYIVPFSGGHRRGRFFGYRLLRVIPVDQNKLSPPRRRALRQIGRELSLGHSVCLMLPVDEKSKSLKAWHEELCMLLQDVPAPIVPIHIERRAPLKKGVLAEFFSLFKSPIKIAYGSQIKTEERCST